MAMHRPEQKTQCAATVRQSGESFIRGLQPHNLEEQPSPKSSEIKTTFKHRAFESATSVVDTVLRNKLGQEPCALPKYDYLVQNANYNGQKVGYIVVRFSNPCIVFCLKAVDCNFIGPPETTNGHRIRPTE